MADKYTQAQQLFNQGLGTVAQAEQNNKELLLKQMQGMFEKAKGRIDLGFKTMKETKNNEAKGAIWNAMQADFGIVAPDFKVGQVDFLDDPTSGALEAMSTIYELGGLEGLNQYAPKIIANLSKTTSGDKEAVDMAGQFMERAMKLDQAQFDRQAPEGAPFEIMQDGKPTLGRVNKQNQFIPIKQGEQTIQKPPEKLPGEVAGKVSSAQSLQGEVKKVKELLFTGKDGKKLDRGQLLMSKVDFVPSKGREAKKRMLQLMENKVRIDSGAAIRPEERQALMDQFFPTLADNDKFALENLNKFEDIMSNFLFVVDPTGKLQLQGDDGSVVDTDIKLDPKKLSKDESAITPFKDQEKEKRYQEWKASQGLK